MKRMNALILAFLMLSLCACHAAPVENIPALLAPVEAQPQIAAVERADVLNMTSMVGCVVPYAEAVSFRVNGTIGTVKALPGQSVHKGDVLAVLDTEALQKNLDNLIDQRDEAANKAALGNRNLEISVEISRLSLEQLIQKNQAELEPMNQNILDLEKKLEDLHKQEATKPAEPEKPTEPEKREPEKTTDPTETTLPSGTEPEVTEPVITEPVVTEPAPTEPTTPPGPSIADQIKKIQKELEDARKNLEKVKNRQTTEEQLLQVDLQDARYRLEHAQQNQYLQMQSMEDNISAVRNQIENAEITAPFDGVITWMSSSAYQNGSAVADEPFVYVSDPTRMTIHTDRIPSANLDNSESIYAEINNQKYTLIPQEISASDDVSKTLNGIRLSSVFEFEDGVSVSAGENSLVYCVYGSRSNVLTIPTNALHGDKNGKYVYRMTDGQKERVDIDIGLISSLRVEVISGLEEGDVIYVAD